MIYHLTLSLSIYTYSAAEVLSIDIESLLAEEVRWGV